jgi:hypothetical protein
MQGLRALCETVGKNASPRDCFSGRLSAVGGIRRRPDGADAAIRFQDGYEHDKAQHFGGEHGEGENILHVSS